MNDTKSRLPTILATSFFTALFLILLFAGGAYWFVSRSYNTSSIVQPPKTIETADPKLNPRRKMSARSRQKNLNY
ncbi:MAG: hypothetical protein LH614_16410 [Pyrinomonadaceae bacterium]|nr:hypothetical protein [Pyrinomonadaceae bacterium]